MYYLSAFPVDDDYVGVPLVYSSLAPSLPSTLLSSSQHSSSSSKSYSLSISHTLMTPGLDSSNESTTISTNEIQSSLQVCDNQCPEISSLYVNENNCHLAEVDLVSEDKLNNQCVICLEQINSDNEKMPCLKESCSAGTLN